MGKITNATTTHKDGIVFRSKLEARAYELFQAHSLDFYYETERIVLQEGFKPSKSFYKGRNGILVQDSTRVRSITYTPDFIINKGTEKVFVETKGFKTDSYNIKVKLFRKYLEGLPNASFFEVSSIRDINKVINYVKDKKD